MASNGVLVGLRRRDGQGAGYAAKRLRFDAALRSVARLGDAAVTITVAARQAAARVAPAPVAPAISALSPVSLTAGVLMPGLHIGNALCSIRVHCHGAIVAG
jgi:hypothetical protein